MTTWAEDDFEFPRRLFRAKQGSPVSPPGHVDCCEIVQGLKKLGENPTGRLGLFEDRGESERSVSAIEEADADALYHGQFQAGFRPLDHSTTTDKINEPALRAKI